MPPNNPNFNQVDDLRIIAWSAAGILNRLSELESHIYQHNIDIVLISETHLVETDSIEIKGYHIYTANHPSNRRRGGSATIINHNIEHMALPTIVTPTIQCAPVCISLSDQPSISISAIY